MLQVIHTNKLGYKSLVVLMNETDNPAFGTPISVDLQDWLSPQAADVVWNRGFMLPKDFIEKAGVYEAMIAAVRLDNPALSKRDYIVRANKIVEAIRAELSL